MKFELFDYVVQDKESYEAAVKALQTRYETLLAEAGQATSKLKSELLSKDLGFKELNQMIAELETKLAKQEAGHALETKWNTRRPHTENFRYPARTLLNRSELLKIDPRIFFTPADGDLPVINGDDPDAIAFKCLQWVHKNIKYTSDISQFKHEEEWLFAHETLLLRNGDCDDGSILMANMMVKSGIPYWRVRLNAGLTRGGGHCFVTYLSKNEEWLILDWCYDYKSQGQPWSKAEKYFDIWFSFNSRFLFAADMLDR